MKKASYRVGKVNGEKTGKFGKEPEPLFRVTKKRAKK